MKHRYFLPWILWQATGIARAENRCFEGALAPIFGTTPAPNLRPRTRDFLRRTVDNLNQGQDTNQDTRHLDDMLYGHVVSRVAQMNGVQRKNFLKVLAEMKIEDRARPSPYLKNPAKATWGFVSAQGPLRLRIEPLLQSHPYSRIVMAHEFSHLERVASRVHGGRSLTHGLVDKHFGFSHILAEERKAYGDEYDFMRASYRTEDLPRLERDYAKLSDTQENQLFRALGIPRDDNGEFRAEDEHKIIERLGSEDADRIRDLIRILNASLIRRVGEALNLSREDYVSLRVDQEEFYVDKQRASNQKILTQWATVLGTSAAAGLALTIERALTAPTSGAPQTSRESADK